MNSAYATTIIVCLLFFLPMLSFAQSTEIKGTIIDESDNLPLIGVSVQEKGTTNGTTTDLDGNFTLRVSDATPVLIITYIGYTMKEIPANKGVQMQIELGENTSVLEEVIVVGYGTQTRSEISGAVSTISTEDITSTPALRVEQTLQGRTAGVQVAQNSGSPGSTMNVRIRGIGTIKNSDPLYVIDGFPSGGIDYLNPGDIESISILKDAASCAIYGARGANGVVLITTKNGGYEQQPTISYNMYYGIQSPWKKINLLSAKEYAILSNEAHLADGRIPIAEFSDPDALGEGTDWQDAIFVDAPMQNHQLSVTGGSKTSKYAINAGHFLQNGIIGGDKSRFKRTTFRVNNTHKVFDRLTVGTIVNYTNLNRNALSENNEFNSPVVRALNMDPVTPVQKPDGTFAYSKYSDTDITNPVNALALSNDNYTTNRVVGNVFADIKILKGFNLKSVYNFDGSLGTRKLFSPSFDLSEDPIAGDAPAGEKRLINSLLQENNTYVSSLFLNMLTYSKTIKDKHTMNVIAGTSQLGWKQNYHGSVKSDLRSNDPELAFLDNALDTESAQAWGGIQEFGFWSYFGRLNYEYDDKYLLTAVFRADGSSRFGENNRFGYFPSVSAGWVVSREAFMQDIDWLSFLKLRASWGQNGNAEIGNYSYTTLISSGLSYTFGPDETITNGSAPLTTSNPDLRWETNTQTNVGIDIEFWQGAINFTTDAYIKKTRDMLAVVPIPGYVGFDPGESNVGDVLNTGIEMVLEYKNKKSPLKYSVSGNISFVKNEVISLGEGGRPISAGSIQSAGGSVSRTEVGYPIASFYGYVTDGIFQNQAELEQHAIQSNAQPGDIRFKDLNNDGVIDDLDQTYIGNPTPNFIYGSTINLDYKGVDLALFLQGSHGNDIYNGTVRYDFSYVNKPVSTLNRWTGEGTSTDEPRVSITDGNQNARISDRFVENGSYLRLKNVQLGYSLQPRVLKKLKFEKIRVYVSAQNLLTFTNYSGLDPEIGTRGSLEVGIDSGFYPQARTFLTGLNITF